MAGAATWRRGWPTGLRQRSRNSATTRTDLRTQRCYVIACVVFDLADPLISPSRVVAVQMPARAAGHETVTIDTEDVEPKEGLDRLNIPVAHRSQQVIGWVATGRRTLYRQYSGGSRSGPAGDLCSNPLDPRRHSGLSSRYRTLPHAVPGRRAGALRNQIRTNGRSAQTRRSMMREEIDRFRGSTH